MQCVYMYISFSLYVCVCVWYRHITITHNYIYIYIYTNLPYSSTPSTPPLMLALFSPRVLVSRAASSFRGVSTWRITALKLLVQWRPAWVIYPPRPRCLGLIFAAFCRWLLRSPWSGGCEPDVLDIRINVYTIHVCVCVCVCMCLVVCVCVCVCVCVL